MRHCAICQKTSQMGGTRILLRGHYNPTNWSRKYPNLQTVRMPVAKAGFAVGEQVLICTQCIRTFGKAARITKKKAAKVEAQKVAAEKAAAAAANPKPEPKKEEKPKAKKEAKPKADKPKKEAK